MPVIRYLILRLDAGGWTPIEAYDPPDALVADRRIDQLRAERPGGYALWLIGTGYHRLLRDTTKE